MLSFLLTGAAYSSQEGTDLKAGRPLVERAELIWASYGLSGKKNWALSTHGKPLRRAAGFAMPPIVMLSGKG